VAGVRSAHRWIVDLFAVLLVVQFFLAGLGAFTTVHNKRFSDNNFGPHGVLGTALVILALVIALLAATGRWSRTASRLSAALLGLMILQFVLGVAGAGSAPVLGGLHAANAVLIVAVVYLLVRGTHHLTKALPRSTA
jgi:Family of unknown function (DUF6220)